jgi:ABC-type glycerol-3-phosphate transport system substrate-binding protein
MHISKLNYRRLSKLFLYKLILLTIAFSNCKVKSSSKEDVRTDNQIKPTTNLMFIGNWYKEGLREKLVKDIVREYEFTHQDVNIVLKFPEEVYFKRTDQSTSQIFISKIVLEANPEWDIIRINDDYEGVREYLKDKDWAAKYLVDFSSIKEFRENTMPELLSDSYKNRWGGIIPGPYVEGANWTLWCNTAVAKKMGINVKQFGMNFDDLLSYVKASFEYNKSHNDYIIPLFESNWRTTFLLALHLYASELSDKNEFNGDFVSQKKLSSWFKTLKALEQLSKYNAISSNYETTQWSDTIMTSDKCLFFVNGSWMYNSWQGKKPQKLKDILPCELPVFQSFDMYVGGYQIAWAVLKNAPHKDEAIKFLLALNKADNANTWVNYTKSPTGIKGSLSTVSFGIDQFESFSAYIQQKYGANKYQYTSTNSEYIFGFSKRETTNFQMEVLAGEISADEAIMKIKKAIQK